MKKFISKIVMMVAIAISFSAAADAQFVIKIRPPQPVITVRPPAPSPVHVWVSGEYTRRGDQYEYREGHWDRPPRRGNHRYTEGRWNHNRRGYYWTPGQWR